MYKKINQVSAQTENVANRNNTIFPYFQEVFEQFEAQQDLRNEAIFKRDEAAGVKEHCFPMTFTAKYINYLCQHVEQNVNRYFPKTMREGAIGCIGLLMECANIAGIWSDIDDEEWDEIVAVRKDEEETQGQE